MAPAEIEKQVKLFESKHGQFTDFANALKSLVTQLLRGQKLEYVQLECRAKTIESFRDKISREDKNYIDPINEVTDMAGLRVITYQLSDLERASTIIAENFEVDPANSVDKRQSLEADRFGYVSVHYVVGLNPERLALPEYAGFAGFRGEIQIRTVLQHAWAAIDHKLRYKSKEQIPENLRRQLYRVSALLETADEQFQSLNARLLEVRKEYSESVTKGTLDLPLNVESLSAYVSESDNARKLLEKSKFLEIKLAPHNPNARLPEYSSLLDLVVRSGAERLSDFDANLTKVAANAEEILRGIVEKWMENVSSPSLRLVFTRESLLRMMYFISLPQERANSLKDEISFGPALIGAVEMAYRRFHKCTDFTINS